MWHLCMFGLEVLIRGLPVCRQYFKICDKEITQQVSADTDGTRSLPLRYASIQSQGDEEKLVTKMKKEQLGKEEGSCQGMCPGDLGKDQFNKYQVINVSNPVDRSSSLKTEQCYGFQGGRDHLRH